MDTELAVLVNTKFPTIQEVLTSKLNQATQAMQEGKRFCLKLKFGEAVMQWYAQQVDPHMGLKRTDFGSMTFYIHNCSSPINCCLNPLVIVFCFPLWLFGGSCYCIQRKMDCMDVSHCFRDIPVNSLTQDIKACSHLKNSFSI
ncbi:uncharacterized protein LOC134241248 [Saccostrea cucullata]|uniref:uncharacterized protein LOC134241248 n=1 Tax=Saccostrea cuccullata TaxID=36930 RepID=UPI002ED2CFAA